MFNYSFVLGNRELIISKQDGSVYTVKSDSSIIQDSSPSPPLVRRQRGRNGKCSDDSELLIIYYACMQHAQIRHQCKSYTVLTYLRIVTDFKNIIVVKWGAYWLHSEIKPKFCKNPHGMDRTLFYNLTHIIWIILNFCRNSANFLAQLFIR